jgi:Delta 1-pyrroline-5-carboxylate dehydrogenase
VFTRKAMTDLCYVACTRKLLARARLYPQFATHNALTVASVIDMPAGGRYEFQRLHGMGEVLYDLLLADIPRRRVGSTRPSAATATFWRIWSVGCWKMAPTPRSCRSRPILRCRSPRFRRPQDRIGDRASRAQPKLPLPRDLYAPERRNSSGVEFGDRASLDALLAEIRDGKMPNDAAPFVNGSVRAGAERVIHSPIDGKAIGRVSEADDAIAAAAMAAAESGFADWAATPVDMRAAVLERASNLLEAARGPLIALLQAEGGKTLDDAVAETREAADFCRYYAAGSAPRLGGRADAGADRRTNELRYRGRGVFVCISPWNFPLSIFLGQVAAALAAGNAVVAKPAEQTPLIAAEAVRILHQAGVPPSALHLLPGDGKVGAALVADRASPASPSPARPRWRAINRTLAAKDAPMCR